MKLFMVGASPYARKVRAAAVQLGLEDRIEIVIANPHHRPAELLALNPLSKVPTLLDDEGGPHVDSFAICEFLSSLATTALLPAAGDARRTALRRHTLAHGVMDCAVIRRVEGQKGPDADRRAWIERQENTIARVLDWFEGDPDLDGPPSLDRLTLGAALGFLDFRFPDDGWRDGRPRLAEWHAAFDRTPPMERTRPFE